MNGNNYKSENNLQDESIKRNINKTWKRYKRVDLQIMTRKVRNAIGWDLIKVLKAVCGIKKKSQKKTKKTVKLTMWLNNEIEELVLVKVITFDIWLKTKSHFSNPFVVIIAFN